MINSLSSPQELAWRDLVALAGAKYPCGHPATPENTYTCLYRDGVRRDRCRTCQRLRTRAWWWRKYYAQARIRAGLRVE